MMTMVSEMMTRNVITIGPHDSPYRAAQLMRDINVASLPIYDDDGLVGMVTDRDIKRVLSSNRASVSEVKDISSRQVRWCFDDDDVFIVEEEMTRLRVHRLPVMDHNKRLIGILSLGDIKRKSCRK